MRLIATSTLAATAFASAAALLPEVHAAPDAMPSGLKAADDFSGIANRRARSVALFGEAAKVIMSPRCLNCHPATERPLQGDDMHPHEPPVKRGVGGMGAPGMRCVTCHGANNFDPGGVPGNPRWLLAPAEMAWVGKTPRQICAQIKDPHLNGHKSMAELVDHMAHDQLVGWGWQPGAGRTPAPGTQRQFGELIQAWVDTGAQCPGEVVQKKRKRKK
jgi:hypothetical protein